MPSSGAPAGFPAVFPALAWELDLAATTPAGRNVAQQTRRRFEATGVPLSELRPCRAEGPDGTNLRNCLKVYLPPPFGDFRMVFRFALTDAGGLQLLFAAFGVGHHPAGSHALTAYQRAHNRIHGQWTPWP